jgi:hypothetical protein
VREDVRVEQMRVREMKDGKDTSSVAVKVGSESISRTLAGWKDRMLRR